MDYVIRQTGMDQYYWSGKLGSWHLNKSSASIFTHRSVAERQVEEIMAGDIWPHMKFEIVPIGGAEVAGQDAKGQNPLKEDLSHLVGKYVLGYDGFVLSYLTAGDEGLTGDWKKAEVYNNYADIPKHTGSWNVFEIMYIDGEVKPVELKGQPVTTPRPDPLADLYSKEPPIPLDMMKTEQPQVFDYDGLGLSTGFVKAADTIVFNKLKPKLIVEVGEGENIVKFYDDGSYELLGAWVVKGNKAVPVQNVTGEIGGSDEH